MAVRAFAGTANNGAESPLQGNPCHVTAWAEATGAVPAPGELTRCYTWPTAAGSARVRCWSPNGLPIKLCGHGLMSCGTVLSESGMDVQTLSMNETSAQFERHKSASWIGLPRLASFDCSVPSWALPLFHQQPESAAEAGHSDDYLILIWPADFPLHELPFPTEMGSHTQRAVIATCMDTSSSGFDIHFRYFAPQYSDTEDAATGSAMRVLADYWQPLLGDSLRARQCSPQGGELLSRIEPEITWVGGQVLHENDEGADEKS